MTETYNFSCFSTQFSHRRLKEETYIIFIFIKSNLAKRFSSHLFLKVKLITFCAVMINFFYSLLWDIQVFHNVLLCCSSPDERI